MSLKSIRKDKGFWDGRRGGAGTAKESGGRSSGHPGPRRIPECGGVYTDLEQLPTPRPAKEAESDS